MENTATAVSLVFWSLSLYVVAGVDDTEVVTLKFSNNRMAVFISSSDIELPNDAVIVGTKGTIRVGRHCRAAFSNTIQIA